MLRMVLVAPNIEVEECYVLFNFEVVLIYNL